MKFSLAVFCSMLAMSGVIVGVPDFTYVPSRWVIPGMDFLGYGFDARKPNAFQSLMPKLFRWSYNDNPRGYERAYRYPLDYVEYAVPDQVEARTVAKTRTGMQDFRSSIERQTALMLAAGVKGNFSTISGEIQFAYNNVHEGAEHTRETLNVVQYELYQIYVADRIYDEKFEAAVREVERSSYTRNPLLYTDFIDGWGTHYIDSITTGGAIKQTTRVTGFSDKEYDLIKAALKGRLEMQTGAIQGNISLEIQNQRELVDTKLWTDAEVYGGAADYTDFVLNGGVDYEAVAALFKSWKQTLIDNPMPVRYRLVEMWTLLRNDEARKDMCLAIAESMGFTLDAADDHCAGTDFLQQGNTRFGIGYFEE